MPTGKEERVGDTAGRCCPEQRKGWHSPGPGEGVPAAVGTWTGPYSELALRHRGTMGSSWGTRLAKSCCTGLMLGKRTVLPIFPL